MKKFRIIITLFSVLFILLEQVPRVFALRAEALPSEISPGDVFVLKVYGAGVASAPEAAPGDVPVNFTACGKHCFVAIGAFGIETQPGDYTIKIKTGQTALDVHIIVKHTVFPTINLTLPEKEVMLSPEDLDRAKSEQKLLESIWKQETPRLWEGDFSLPLPTEISTPFGYRRILNKKRISIHRGIDMRGHEGEEIKACNRGRVVLTKNLFFGGNTVVLDHGMGIYSIYMHLSKFDVKPGDIVSRGQTVGLVGATGRATGPHLHFSMKVHDISANPVSFTRLPL
jgi:murein DD-endopeptidase MepM/ murein hydrolase activator NlpD